MTPLKRPPSWVVLHRTGLDVRVTDLNYCNHLGDDALLGYLHHGRVKLLDGLGWGELDVRGVGVIMRGCQIDFVAESFLFDTLELEVGLAMSGRARCRFDYRLTRMDDQIPVAAATTDMVFLTILSDGCPPPPGYSQTGYQG